MKNTLDRLRSSQSLPSVSLIIPSALKSFADKESLEIRLKEDINKVEKKLAKDYDSSIVNPLMEKLKELAASVNFSTLSPGIGFFVSKQIGEKVDIQFPVVARTIIADKFDISDLEEQENALFDYNVLVLSRKESRLFSAKGDQLIPTKNDFFPAEFLNDFQVKRSDKFSFYNNEESKINQSRIDSYFRNLDKEITKENKNIPLVLVGTVENRSDFKNIKKSPHNIIAEVNGNMDKISISELAKKVWNVVHSEINTNA